ncbi:MAG: ABC transporter permease subunit [Deltaproteobacteria bacterium]|nr:ABC transporter permease subunit [Deltaproteobacteria bacterium]
MRAGHPQRARPAPRRWGGSPGADAPGRSRALRYGDPEEIAAKNPEVAEAVAEGEAAKKVAADTEGLSAARTALELRRAQARQALVEGAEPSEAQLANIDAAVETMNASLSVLADELVATLESGEEPSRRDAMAFAADALDTLINVEDQIYDALTPSSVRPSRRAPSTPSPTSIPRSSTSSGRWAASRDRPRPRLVDHRPACSPGPCAPAARSCSWRCLACRLGQRLWLHPHPARLREPGCPGAPCAQDRDAGRAHGRRKADVDSLDMMRAMVGGDEALLQWPWEPPLLTVTHFWTGLGTLPFIAAAAGAEAVSSDIHDRSIRFELVRAGRLEIVAGRFLGLSLLLGVAVFGSTLGVWAVAMLGMINNPPLEQMTTLLSMSPRLWMWCLPFCGLGVAASQLTANVNLARLIALAAVAFTWIAYGVIEAEVLEGWMQAVAESVQVLCPRPGSGAVGGPAGAG